MEQNRPTDDSGKNKKLNNFKEEGVRLRSDILTLEYRPGKSFFKSIGKNTSHLEKMGLRRADGNFLNIEEALFLTEMGAALVVDHRGNSLTIQQLYGLLGQMRVSSLKYTIFAQLTRSGYIVRRPTPCSSNEGNDDLRQGDFAQKIRIFRYQRELLDQFPSIQTIKINNIFGLQMLLPQIQCHNNFSIIFKNDESSNQIELGELNGRLKEIIQQSLPNHLSIVRRWDRDPWEQYRPRHWPSFHSLRSLENWHYYGTKRDELLRKERERRQIQRPKSSFQPIYDYLLFGNASSNAPPLYRVLVVDDRFPNGRPNFAELQKLASHSENGLPFPSLLIATGVPNCFKINQFQMENNQSLSV